MYWMAGLQAVFSKFLIFSAIIITTSITGEGFGLFIGAISPNVAIARVLAPVLTILFVLLGGFYINNQSISPVFIWIEYISFIKYSFSAFMDNEFEGLIFTCQEDEIIFNASGQPSCPIRVGSQVLRNLDIEGSILQNIGVLFLLMITFRILAYLFIRILKPRQRAIRI